MMRGRLLALEAWRFEIMSIATSLKLSDIIPINFYVS